MLDFFKKKKPLIDRSVKKRLRAAAKDFSRVSRWGADVCGKMERFTLAGKTIRGGLVLLAYNLCGGKPAGLPDALNTAAAVELAQSSFLIHDDIMDRDIKRRGKSSFFYQYKELGDRLKCPDSYHFGESLGICAGDAGFFIAFGLLAQLKSPASVIRSLAALFSRELNCVALAQMQDVFAGHRKGPATEKEILKVYLYKTGRYTFSLPLLMGAALAGKTEKECAALSDIGEKLGIIFQIKDDELGLFGSEKEIGKSVGSDIRENKKSLYHHYLYKLSGASERKKLDRIFGNPKVTPEEIEYIRTQIMKKGIRNKLDGIVEKMTAEAGKLAGLVNRKMKNINRDYMPVLDDLLRYSAERSR